MTYQEAGLGAGSLELSEVMEVLTMASLPVVSLHASPPLWGGRRTNLKPYARTSNGVDPSL